MNERAAGTDRFRRLTAAAIALLFLALAGPAFAQVEPFDPPTVRLLKTQYQQLVDEYRGLVENQKSLLEQQAKIADEIESIQDSNPGLLGRLRLEKLLARNLEISNQLSEVAQWLSQNAQARQAKRDVVYRAYTAEMEQVVRQLRETPDRKAATGLVHRFYVLEQNRAPWWTQLSIENDFSGLAVVESESDGPDELLAKADILTDLVGKIRLAKRELDREIQRLQREAKLSQEMNHMVKEMNLFEEGTKFLRETTKSNEPTVSPPAEGTESGAHVPPLTLEPDKTPVGERAAKSIDADIRRLKHERALLDRLENQFSAKADELRKKARELRRRESFRHADPADDNRCGWMGT